MEKRILASDPEYDEIDKLARTIAILRNRHLYPFDEELQRIPEDELRAAIATAEQMLWELLVD